MTGKGRAEIFGKRIQNASWYTAVGQAFQPDGFDYPRRTESLARCVRLESLTYGSVMNDNPYASPKTHQESPIDRRRGVQFSEMNSAQWLILLGGWLVVGVIMIGSCMFMMSVCERIESALGPRGMTQGFQWLYGIAILGVPILLGKATAVIYKRQYVRIASEIARRNGE